MNIKTRVGIEKRILRSILLSLTREGFNLRIHDGGGWASELSNDVKYLTSNCMSTDEDIICVYRPNQPPNTRHGWVHLVYGNDGFDVINDYAVIIEDELKAAFAVAKRAEESGK